jgi:transcriptional regulator with XRE-family HTH domain
MKPADIDKQIGLAIKALRIKKGLTQLDVAEKQNITYQQIQKYESGKSSIQVNRLFSICRELNVSVEELLRDALQSFTLSEPEAGYGKRRYINEQVTKEELRLLKLFRKIENKKFKEGLFKLLSGYDEVST